MSMEKTNVPSDSGEYREKVQPSQLYLSGCFQGPGSFYTGYTTFYISSSSQAIFPFTNLVRDSTEAAFPYFHHDTECAGQEVQQVGRLSYT